jgi:hypothetical protein
MKIITLVIKLKIVKENKDIKHNKTASESFLGRTIAISNLKVADIAINCITLIKTAKTPKSFGLKNLVKKGSNNKAINWDEPTPLLRINILRKYTDPIN